ncbi:MAG TPA: 30S ribosomal protein S2 [Candidatus Nanoarchaeia archaeon]|nr:30S ribosomal protein S2 [Candidatus Nanoarchaeia archaeon]
MDETPVAVEAQAEQVEQPVQNLLVPLEEYLKAGLHIGTKFRTKYMEPFIYKIRPDGLTVLNVQKIDERIGMAARFMAKYSPEQILVVGRRENSWKAAKMFSKVTGTKVFVGRYPPGILTNPNLDNFMEIKLLIVTDPGPEKNAVRDAVAVGVPVIAFCDTNNESNYVDFVVPCNNKGKKSLGLVFYILARGYMKGRGLISKDEEFTHQIGDFVEE